MSFLDYYRPKTKLRLLAGERVHWVHSHKRWKYIQQCVLSFPSWVNRKECEEFFEKARVMQLKTGIEYSVDHIIPLNHPRVCGLSVPWNFQVLPKHVNDSKGNAWCEWHGELFDKPEQLRLF